MAASAAVPPPAAAAVVLPVVEAAPVARPARNWRSVRVKWAKALFILGFAAAALACFAINNSSPTAADTSRVLGGACAPTEAETAALRAVSEQLLLAAAAQVLGATTAVLVPARPVAVFATLLGWPTVYHAPRVVLRMLVGFACHGRGDAVLAIYYCIFVAVMWVAFLVGAVVSIA